VVLDLTLALSERDLPGDQLRSLYGWLAGAEELKGRIRLVERPPEPGTLGPVADVVLALQAPLVALVGALVAWIRNHHSDIDVTVIRPDGGRTTISASHVRRAGAAELASMIDGLVQQVGGLPEPVTATGPGEAPAG
jgi:hypothetical protein